MLFQLDPSFKELTAVPFLDFQSNAKLEKDLENLVARHLFGVLFEGPRLLPFHQERPLQPEADIYALDEHGDIAIFELKRSTASGDALDQLLRYAQEAGQWSYTEIERRLKAYPGNIFGDLALRQAHKAACELEEALREDQFNRNQHLWLIGHAADEMVIRGVDFWKNKGLSIEFLPYRVYEMHGERYFEFFSKPYDTHTNPTGVKGVLFDTCATYIPEALRWMVERKRISAYGDRKDAVRSLAPGDHVFYSHCGVGLVAAAQVIGKKVLTDKCPSGDEELYWNVKFLTSVPSRFDASLVGMPFAQVKQVTGKSFYWARIQKVPYLNREESVHLLDALQKVLKRA